MKEASEALGKNGIPSSHHREDWGIETLRIKTKTWQSISRHRDTYVIPAASAPYVICTSVYIPSAKLTSTHIRKRPRKQHTTGHQLAYPQKESNILRPKTLIIILLNSLRIHLRLHLLRLRPNHMQRIIIRSIDIRRIGRYDGFDGVLVSFF